MAEKKKHFFVGLILIVAILGFFLLAWILQTIHEDREKDSNTHSKRHQVQVILHS